MTPRTSAAVPTEPVGDTEDGLLTAVLELIGGEVVKTEPISQRQPVEVELFAEDRALCEMLEREAADREEGAE